MNLFPPRPIRDRHVAPLRSISIVIILSCLASFAARADGVAWNLNYDIARTQALREGKLLLLYFEQSSEERSDKMNRETWNQQSIIDLTRRFVCVRIDYEQMRRSSNILLKDRNERLALRHNITTIPATVVADPFDDSFLRVPDFQTTDEMHRYLQPLPADLSPLYDILKKLDADRGNDSLIIAAGDAFALLNIPDLSNIYYDLVKGSRSVAADTILSVRLCVARGVNEHALGRLQRSIDLLEECLDLHPSGNEQAHLLYLLIRYLLEDLQEDRAQVYLNLLQKEFSGSPFRKRAEELFTQKP